MQMSLWNSVFTSFGYIPRRSRIAGFNSSFIFLIFWGTSMMLSIVTEAVCIPTESFHIFLLFTSLPLLIFCFCDKSHSNRWKVISLCDFALHFPDLHFLSVDSFHTIYWRNCLFLYVLLAILYKISLLYLCCFISEFSTLFSWFIYVFLQVHTYLIIIALWCSLRSGNVMTWALFILLKIVFSF